MGEEATLDEFVNDAVDPSEADGRPAVASDVEPAWTTYAFTPGGATCAACGSTTARRWQQDDDLVCADCKEW